MHLNIQRTTIFLPTNDTLKDDNVHDNDDDDDDYDDADNNNNTSENAF